jgi:hypothetical protein
MNKYKVKVAHVFSELIDVEAETPEQAKEKAEEILKDQNRDSDPSYETTIPPEHWPVITEEEYNAILKAYEAEIGETVETNKEESNIITP